MAAGKRGGLLPLEYQSTAKFSAVAEKAIWELCWKKKTTLQNHPKTCAEFYIARAIAITIQLPTFHLFGTSLCELQSIFALLHGYPNIFQEELERFLSLEAFKTLKLRVELGRLILCLGGHPQPPPGSSSLKLQLQFPYLRPGKMICFSKWWKKITILSLRLCILSFSLEQIIKAELLPKSLEIGVYSENTDRSITIAMQIQQIKICINDNVI